ncbi:hypothetical protein HanHA300_Chr13g0496471 [Helianthus annuus]|nr:hypothetical protein HanHA300_Chr13g0496471 [Helianthus annuus]KAJ0498987.1 hypothetical protein HanHA89_Chr13g0529121 [Helianthus annuus]KAJ0672425.1 hypothetical protein HanOQP8_Chr13g0497161 [Helianthus annuus]
MLALVALTAKDQSLLLCSTFKIAVIAWNNPWKTSTSGNNTDAILEKLMASGTESQASMEGYATKVSIDAGGNTPSYSAIFYLDV